MRKESILKHSLLLLILFSPMARSQSVVSKGVEVAGAGGWSSLSGADGKSHPAFGGEGGFNAIKNLQLFGEFLYNPLGSIEGVNAKAENFGGGLRYHFGSSRIAPFVVVAGGYHRESAGASGINVAINGAYFGAGGGASLYITPHFGIRPEFRVDAIHLNGLTVGGVSTGSANGHIYVFTTGVFYQFGGR